METQTASHEETLLTVHDVAQILKVQPSGYTNTLVNAALTAFPAYALVSTGASWKQMSLRGWRQNAQTINS